MPRERRGGKVNDPIPIRSWSGGGSTMSGAAIPVYAQAKSTSMPADPESNPTPDGAPTMSEQRGELVGFEDKSNWLARMGRALRGEASMADQLNSQLALGTQASSEARALQGDRLKAELENLREQKAHAERLQQQLIASNLELEDRRGRWGSTAIAERGAEDRLTAEQQFKQNLELKNIQAKIDSGAALSKAEIDFFSKAGGNPANPEHKALINTGTTASLTDRNNFNAQMTSDPVYNEARKKSAYAEALGQFLKATKESQTVLPKDGSVFQAGVEGVIPTYMLRGLSEQTGVGQLGEKTTTTVPPSVTSIDPNGAAKALAALRSPPIGSTAMGADSDDPPVDRRFSVVEPKKTQTEVQTKGLADWLTKKIYGIPTAPLMQKWQHPGIEYGSY